MNNLIPQEVIERKIYLIRGRKVMLDKDLAALYAVETKNLNLQVKRNMRRFPEDFMFQLNKEENLRLQIATSSYGGRRYLAYAFTEQGVAMLSSVLSSERAIELKYKNHDMKLSEYDKHIMAIFEAIRQLMAPPPEKPRRIIGFKQQ